MKRLNQYVLWTISKYIIRPCWIPNEKYNEVFENGDEFSIYGNNKSIDWLQTRTYYANNFDDVFLNISGYNKNAYHYLKKLFKINLISCYHLTMSNPSFFRFLKYDKYWKSYIEIKNRYKLYFDLNVIKKSKMDYYMKQFNPQNDNDNFMEYLSRSQSNYTILLKELLNRGMKKEYDNYVYHYFYYNTNIEAVNFVNIFSLKKEHNPEIFKTNMKITKKDYLKMTRKIDLA